MRSDDKEDKEEYAVKIAHVVDMSKEMSIHKLAAAAGIAPPLFKDGVVYPISEDWQAMPMLKIRRGYGGNLTSLVKEMISLVTKLHDSVNISHGDIKPANFLVSEKGRVYLTDFGCSICHSDPHPSSALFIGDPNYMPHPSKIKAQSFKEKAFEIDKLSLIKTINKILS
jgi:serine/threonine protein kinase